MNTTSETDMDISDGQHPQLFERYLCLSTLCYWVPINLRFILYSTNTLKLTRFSLNSKILKLTNSRYEGIEGTKHALH